MAATSAAPIGPVLVTGANGFVGRAVVAELSRRAWPVKALVRSAPAASAHELGADWLPFGDLSEITDWPARLAGVDSIVHCAARAHVLRENSLDPEAEFTRHNVDMPIRLIEGAVEAGVRRFVFVSSIGVLGDETRGRPLRHDDPPRPHSAYARAKLAAEEALREIAKRHKLELVVVRPPLVIGPGAKGNIGLLARAIAKGVPLPLGLARRNRRNLVSCTTLADLIAELIIHPRAPGETFLVSDGRTLATRGIVEEIGRLEARKPRLLPVPPAIVATALRLVGRRGMATQLFGDLEVDIEHTRRTLDWSPPSAAHQEAPA